eukprot:CAMPEP_0197442016 /NCGR_PEP_ID=MMETSP1175-20131217/8124_1 /TAXON_ID=1003142 /ORGANISM="Triceratium dubium, Strain CCMP147" /LENGTH=644 /DNA_ID=CAMNT_0042972405 /DNA_START=25 /DNA_END=1959 /DNA_ORIENTATION=-
MATSSTAASAAESDPPPTPVSISTVAWKRRSGFGKHSSTVGFGSSWERRKIVLVGTKIAYYEINAQAPDNKGDGGSPKHPQKPRGTLDVAKERLTASPAVHSVDMPTPYGLHIRSRAQSLVGEDETKWKLCFDTGQQQAAFLLALSDLVVSKTVTEFNASVLTAETEKAEHGGFHRLYEEDGPGIFGLVRDVLLESNKGALGAGLPASGTFDSPDQTEEEVGSGERAAHEGVEIVMAGSSHDDNSNDASREEGEAETTHQTQQQQNETREREMNSSPKVVFDPSDGQMRKDQTGHKRKQENILYGEIYLPTNNIRALFGLVNVVIFYTFWVAKASSSPMLSWWQILAFVNFGLWVLLRNPLPKSLSSREKSTSDSQGHELSSERAGEITLTTSTVGAELLKERDVPLSEEPSEKLEKKPADGSSDADTTTATETLALRLDQPSLTEEEMDFHAHERWALSDPKVDLSGSWVLVADEAFKAEYDIYLKNLGFNRFTRGVAVSLIARTTEVTRQSERGRSLYLCGTNPKGSWERTIVASGYPDFETQSDRTAGEDYFHQSHSIKTAEAEDVEAEAWWEERGTIHISWLRGGTKYGGGDFESRRYLEACEEGSVGDILVCESVFHPKKEGKEKAVVTWRFKRVENEQ